MSSNDRLLNAIDESCCAYVNGYAKLKDEDKDRVMLTLGRFVIAAAEKFVKGQREHGGSITDRDCLVEAQLEVIDLLFYISAEQEKRKTSKL